jgi:hypothetical protein
VNTHAPHGVNLAPQQNVAGAPWQERRAGPGCQPRSMSVYVSASAETYTKTCVVVLQAFLAQLQPPGVSLALRLT